MGAFEKLIELRWRAAGHMRVLPEAFWHPLDGAKGLEIGGPSALFRAEGLLPVYPGLGSIDGVQWAADTLWHKLDSDSGYAPDGSVRGELHVIDSVDLDPLATGSYDVVLLLARDRAPRQPAPRPRRVAPRHAPRWLHADRRAAHARHV